MKELPPTKPRKSIAYIPQVTSIVLIGILHISIATPLLLYHMGEGEYFIHTPNVKKSYLTHDC